MSKLLLRDLSPGTTYKVQLRAAGDDDSNWSPLLSFATNTDTRKPSPPTSVTWTSAGRSFIGTWNAPTTLVDGSTFNNSDGFEVRITFSGTTVLYRTKATRFDFTYEMNEAKFGTAKSPLSFAVRAISNQGASSDDAFPTPNPASNPVPAAVGGLSTTSGIEQIQVSWTAPADLDLVGYNVYASQTNGFTPATGNRVSTTNTLQYIHNTSSTAPWYFHVRAVDIFGQESTSVQTTGTARLALGIDLLSPKIPTAVTVNPAFDIVRQQGTLAISWTAPTQNSDNSTLTDLRNYSVRYGTDGTNWNYNTVPSDSTSTRVDVNAGQSYYVQVRSVDFQGNFSAWENASVKTGGGTAYPVAIPADTTEPSTPAIPTAAANTMQIQVTHNNLNSGGTAIETDVAYYDVYAKPTLDTGWVYDATTYLGKLVRSNTTSNTFYIPNAGVLSGGLTVPQTWYVRVFAVDRSGNRSLSPSASATSAPTLIGTLNVADATITNAKITDLVADKLTAGVGVIVDLKIGNATQQGTIRSHDWSAGTAGWRLGTTGGVSTLEINSGLIKARALELSNSPNLMPPMYADFEARSAAYGFVTSALTATIDTSTSKFNQASLKLVSSATGNFMYLAPTSTTYSVNLEETKTYIYSIYAKATSLPATLVMQMKYSDGTFGTSASRVLTTSYARYSMSFTVPAGVTAGVAILGLSQSGVTVNVDAVQIEEVNGASTTTPQPWEPPSTTTITGGQIVTGSIQSNQTTTVGAITVPRWYVDINGDAQFASAKVLGVLTVGGANIAGSGSNTGAESRIESFGFSSGAAVGWRVTAAGDAEFNSATIRGTLSTASVVGDLTLSGGAIRTSNLVGPTSATSSGYYFDSTKFNAWGAYGSPIGTVDYPGKFKNGVFYEKTDDGTTTTINIYEPDGQTIRFSFTVSGLPTAYTMDQNGNILILQNATTTTWTMRRYNATTGALMNTYTTAGVSGGTYASNLQVDSSGNIWYQLSDTNNTIYKYNTSGVLQATYTGKPVLSFRVLSSGVIVGWNLALAIYYYDSSFTQTSTWNLQESARAVSFGPTGLIYSLNTTDGLVNPLDPSSVTILSYRAYAYNTSGTKTATYVNMVPRYGGNGALEFGGNPSVGGLIINDTTGNLYIYDDLLLEFKSGWTQQLAIDPANNTIRANNLEVTGALDADNIRSDGVMQVGRIKYATGFAVSSNGSISLRTENPYFSGSGRNYSRLTMSPTGTASWTTPGAMTLEAAGTMSIYGGTGAITDDADRQTRIAMGTSITFYTAGDMSNYNAQFGSDGDLVLAKHNTTTNSTNMNITTSGTIRRVTSTRASKVDIKPIELTTDQILGIEAVQWHDRLEMERYNANKSEEKYDESNDITPAWIPGVVAEQLEDAGLGIFVMYGIDGKPEGVLYDRLIAAVIPVLQQHEKRLKALEEK